ncbi:MAG TPA: fibronectin type III domain-containing protein, partial [Acidimicrobiia bacterium]|nr:fibronectin type III domain-containing protein [Acidimicrobiia bacterium]
MQNQSGVMLPGANVSLVDASGVTIAQAVAGQDGRYDLAVAPGTYTLVAGATSAGTPVNVTVPGVTVGAATPLDVVIVGRPGGLSQFRGRLLDTSGMPIAAAGLELGGDAKTTTDPAGYFALAAPPGKYHLAVSPWRGPLIGVGDFDLTRDRIGDLTLALVTHDVTVRDSAGNPIAKAWVDVHPANRPFPASPDVLAGKPGVGWYNSEQTDAAGHVRVMGLATSNLEVEVNAPGGSPNLVKSGIDGRRSTTLDLAFPAPPSFLISLSGTPTDAEGVSRPYMSVRLLGPDGEPVDRGAATSAGEPGSFSSVAPPGTYDLRFTASFGPQDDEPGGDPSGDRYELVSKGFKHDRARYIDLRLPAGPALAVRVLDPQGAPVAGAKVTARSKVPTDATDVEIGSGLKASGTLESVRVTDANGAVTLPTLPGYPPSSLQIEAPTDRGIDGKFTVPTGETTFDVHLKRGAVVSGTIRTGGQPGDPHQRIALMSDDGDVKRFINVADDGTYRIHVAPGAHRVVTDTHEWEDGGESDDHEDTASTSSAFDISGDRTLDLDYPAPSRALIRFVGADGAPLEGELNLVSEGARGAFDLAPGITAGASWWFSAFGERDSQSVSTWPGGAAVAGTLDMDINLRVSGIRLSPGGAAVVALAQGYSLVRPDPPGGLTAVARPNGTATVSWDQSANGRGHPITGHLLHIYGAEFRKLVVPAPATSITLRCLLPNAKYNFYVSSMTVRGISQQGYPGVSLLIPDGPGPDSSCPPPAPPSETPGPPGVPPPPDPTPGNGGPNFALAPLGYWILESVGTVHAFGGAPAFPPAATRPPSARAVHIEATPGGQGYWALWDDEYVGAFGNAVAPGDLMGRLEAGERAT